MGNTKTKTSVRAGRSVRTQLGFLAFFCVLLLSSGSGASNSPVDRAHNLSASRRLRVSASPSQGSPAPPLPVPPSLPEYLWYEAENMRGLTETSQHEPQLSPSYLDLPAAKAPGWSISGPGVSAEWSQGGESEWNSVAASADETRGSLWQNVEVPRAGEYKVWIRYADWAGQSENFVVRIVQQDHEVFRREFGARDVIDPHDETSMYWGWVFAWDGATTTLAKGPARVLLDIEKPAQARRQVDCFLITNDLAFIPD